MYKSLYTTSVSLRISYMPELGGPESPGAFSGGCAAPAALPEELGSRRGQSNVVIFDRLSIDITVVDKNRHHSLKHPSPHLAHL